MRQPVTDWDKVDFAAHSDAEIARMHGVTRAAAYQQRKKRGIAMMPLGRRRALNSLRALLGDDGPVLRLLMGDITYSRFVEMLRERVDTGGATQSEIRPLMMTPGWVDAMERIATTNQTRTR